MTNVFSKTKAFLSVLMALSILLVLVLPAGGTLPVKAAESWDGKPATSFAGGSGSSSSPYQIKTPGQLLYMANQVNSTSLLDSGYNRRYYKLMADIDLANQPWTPIGTEDEPFCGDFDGNGFTIRGLNYSYDMPTDTYNAVSASDRDSGGVGLFGNTNTHRLKSTVKICNLTVVGSVVTDQYTAGGLIGSSTSELTLENCHFIGTVQSGSSAYVANCGGLIGLAQGNTTIKNCTVKGTVKGDATVLTLYNSETDTTLTQKAQHPENVGGFVGNITNSKTLTISDSCADITLEGENGTGGLLGTALPGSTVTIERCYTKGSVVSTSTGARAGGLIGWARDNTATADNTDIQITVTDCYSVMNMTKAPNAAGLFNGARTPGAAADVKVSMSRCHFAGSNAKYPIANYQSDLWTLGTAEHLYYRAGSLQNGASDPFAAYTEEKTAKEFSDGTVAELLGNENWLMSEENYPVLASQKVPTLTALTLDGVALNLTAQVYNKTVAADAEKAVVTATPEDGATVTISAVDENGSTVSVSANGEVALRAGCTTTVTVNVKLGLATKTYTLYLYRNPTPWDGTVADGFAAGDGTTDNPYEIANAKQLALLAKITIEGATVDGTAIATSALKDTSFVLTADIDLGGKSGQLWNPIGGSGGFAGELNGQNYTVSNMYIHSTEENMHCVGGRAGLFSKVTWSAVVSNLHVENATITDEDPSVTYANRIVYLGGFAGTLEGTLNNCSFSGDITSTHTNYGGGLVGSLTADPKIHNCWTFGTFNGSVENGFGGLVGSTYFTKANPSTAITNSWSGMALTQTKTSKNVAGLLGAMLVDNNITGAAITVPVTNSYFIGTVSGGAAQAPISCSKTVTNTATAPSTVTIAPTNLYYSNDWSTDGDTEIDVVIDNCFAADMLDFADGTVTAKLGTEWATSTAGYPVPSDIGAQYRDVLDVVGSSMRSKGDSQGIRFKFSISDAAFGADGLREVGVLVAKQSAKIPDDRLIAHRYASSDTERYYKYVEAAAYTKGVDKTALVDQGDVDHFTAALYNFTTKERYQTEYIARPYAKFIDANGQEVVVYGGVLGDAEYYNSVFELAEYYYDPHNGNALELSELLYVQQTIETIYDEVLPETVLPEGETSASAFDPQEGGADAEANALRQEILITTDDLATTEGTTYYVSPNGNDGNDGLSPQTAWRSVDAVRLYDYRIQPGDTVLFERDGVYRTLASFETESVERGESQSTETVLTAKDGVTYGAYGDGDKPVIYGSYKNYAWNAEWWTNYVDENKTVHENIWKVATPYSDIGVITFDHGVDAGIKRFWVDNYETVLNADKWPSCIDAITDLNEQFEYYHDYTNGWLYLYFEGGNPGEVYEDIEFGPNVGMLVVPADTTDVTVDNLAIKYTGYHCVRIDTDTENVTVQNCELGWIGGCESFYTPNTTARIGNAIESWENITNCVVQNNWIYQVFDAGITPQGLQGSHYKDIYYIGNLVEYCSYNIEWFDREGKTSTQDSPTKEAIWDNFVIKDNILRFAGYGFAKQRTDGYATSHITGWAWKYETQANVKVYIQNNTFDCSTHNAVYWTCTNGQPYEYTVIEGNTFYDKAYGDGQKQIIYYPDGQKYVTASETFEDVIKYFDSNPKLVKWLGTEPTPDDGEPDDGEPDKDIIIDSDDLLE